jgi:biopolymer transport protein ExbB
MRGGVLVAVVGTICGGCFQLDIPPGSLRCTEECPGEMECVEGRCFPKGWKPSADATYETDLGAGADLDGAPPPGWWNAAWSRRRKLTFHNAAAQVDLLDFPVLVVLDASRVDYSRTRTYGEDVRFVDADGKTVLAHEIEAWTQGGTSFIWVRVPKVDMASTTDHIWLYHGNGAAGDGQQPAAVWHPSYKAVWHLHDGFQDSTANAMHATNFGSTDAPGVIADGRAFDGQGQYIDTNDSRDLQSFTVMVWAQGASVPDNDDVNGPLLREENYQLCWDHAAPYPRAAVSYLHTGGIWRAAQFGTLQAETWYLLAATLDGGTLVAYVNGAKTDSDTQSPVTLSSTHTAKIGRHAHKSSVPVNFFEGRVDEVRIADVARSADWIAAQHASMTDAFIGYGMEESR